LSGCKAREAPVLVRRLFLTGAAPGRVAVT